MTTRVFSRWMVVAWCIGAVAVMVPVGAADGNKACGLLTPAELESVLGAKVTLSGGVRCLEAKQKSVWGRPQPRQSCCGW
jgi:hypothetical protein